MRLIVQQPLLGYKRKFPVRQVCIGESCILELLIIRLSTQKNPARLLGTHLD